jgi:CRP-like cAMP-binding protein
LDIVHRDLKPENVLCATKEALDVKIADFGLSKIIDTENPQVLQTCCGTPSYAAPELLLCEGYNAPVDLWAVGVILYTLLSGCLPFFGETHSELFERILAGAYAFPDPEWTNVSSAAKSLVTALLTADPKKRLTAEQALHHPWILNATGTNLTGHSNRMELFVKNEKNEKAKTSSHSLRDRYSQVVTQNVLGPQIYEDSAYGEAERISNRQPLVWDDTRDWPLMSKGAKLVSFKKDDFILKEGNINRNFYRVKIGSVRVEKARAEGKPVTLLKMSEGLMFGEISMLQASGIISASIRANDDITELFELNANQLKKTLDEEQHELAERFYRELALKQAQRLSQARQRIEEVLEKEGINAIKSRQAARTRTASFANTNTKAASVQLSKMFGLRTDENCILALPCRWKRTLLHAGTVYVSTNYICGTYNFFALKSKTVIPFDTITSIDVSDKDLEIRIGCKKQKQAKNVFQMQTKEEFKSTFELLESLWSNSGQKGSSVNLLASSSQMLVGQSIEVDQSLSDALTADDWKLILDKSKQLIYNKNDVVIKQGDQSPQNLYQLAHGRCRVEQVRPEDDSVQVVGVINSGETFGEISFLQNSQITASVVADDDRVEIYVIEGDHLNEIFNEFPAVPGRFYKYLATLISNRLHNREIEILS